ncbi:MAG TPA: hypothetical protein VNA14_05605 [Mycobacteriales bacterium]|nr:hypothetical protein [Mycobacteriales bacterium]
MSPVILLGPQGPRPNLPQTLAALDVPGPIATVTAGWEERETEDADLDTDVGGATLNLQLFRRWVDVLHHDPEYHDAVRRRDVVLEEMQEIYALRLDHAMEAVYAVQRRGGHPEVHDNELTDSIDAVRALDEHHFTVTRDVYAEFYELWPPHSRVGVAAHRDEVAAMVGRAGSVAIAGGHVGVLQACLHMFNVGAALGDRPVVAWSAGAMAISERIVLFHDRAPQGAAHAAVFDAGIGLCSGVLPFPDAKRRLLLQDRDRMSVLARRFAPLACVALDEGTRAVTDADGRLSLAGARVIQADGRTTTTPAGEAA